MQATTAQSIASTYQKTHERVIQIVESLSDEHLGWRPREGAPSIAFNVWHLARWADQLHVAIPGMTEELGRRLGPSPEIWETAALAEQWGLDAARLGFMQTGMLMDDETTSQLQLPGKDALLDYARRAFAAAERAVDAIDDEQLAAVEREQWADEDRETLGTRGTVGQAILVHLTHDNRHLGMLECLRGLLEGRGTATQ